MALKGPVEFKGKLNGLYLNLDPNENFDVIVKYLRELLVNRASFYQGSRIIGVKGRPLTYKEKAVIETIIFDEYGITIESLEDPETALVSKSTEIDKILISVSQNEDLILDDSSSIKIKSENEQSSPATNRSIVDSVANTQPYSDTKFVYGTMRSGKSVHYPGHVVIIGDINPGAEVVAEGNIIVMGRVLGFIHAGSAGNEKAVIIANLLKPTQIRISTFISVPPSDDETHHTNVPEKATVCDGVIKIEKCH